MREIRDARGEVLKVGDIVFRAKHSSLTVHKIVRFCSQSIVLTCKKGSRTYMTRWYNDRYNETQIEQTYSYIMDTYLPEQVNEHEDTMYYTLPWQFRRNGEASVILNGIIKL